MSNYWVKFLWTYLQPTLVFTAKKGTFTLKVCLEENGGRWLSDHRTGGEKRPNNCWSVKVSKFSFPFPLEAKEEGEKSFWGPKIVKCYFSSPFFDTQGELKSCGYSSLVTIPFQNWGLFRCCVPFRPPGILCSLLDELCHVYGWNEIVKSFFFPSPRTPSLFSLFTNHSLSWNHAECL